MPWGPWPSTNKLFSSDTVHLGRIPYESCKSTVQIPGTYRTNIAQIRLQNSIDCNFPGVFGKDLPLKYNPATSIGSSLSFSSVPHIDSSIKLTDSIIWEPDYENKIPYIFRNSYAKINFLIDKPCMIYQPTKDLHGTVNTGNHNGVGFVNLSKSNLLNKTDYLTNWYNLYKKN